MLVFYLTLGFVLFFLQHLIPFPANIRLDLLTLFVVFVTLRAEFIVAVMLALVLGFILDCYGLGPLGLQVAHLLTAVLGTALVRRRLNLLYILPQIAGVAIIMLLQGIIMAGLLHLLLPVPVVYPSMLRQGFLQLGITALSAPVVLGLFRILEKVWRHYLLRKSLRISGEQ